MDLFVFTIWMTFGGPTVITKGTGFYYIGLTIRMESLDSNYGLIHYTEPVCLLSETERHFTCHPGSSCALAYVISSTVSHSWPDCWPQCLDPEYKEKCSEKLTRLALGRGIRTSPDWTYMVPKALEHMTKEPH